MNSPQAPIAHVRLSQLLAGQRICVWAQYQRVTKNVRGVVILIDIPVYESWKQVYPA